MADEMFYKQNDIGPGCQETASVWYSFNEII